jgi:hypothetical protein
MYFRKIIVRPEICSIKRKKEQREYPGIKTIIVPGMIILR